MKTTDENILDAAEREQVERAQKLTASFASTTHPIGGEKLRKPSQADLLILGMVGNRFVNGFTPAETAQAGKGQLVPFLLDIIQWREVCRADDATREAWISDPESFRRHVVGLAMTAPANIAEITDMFRDVLTAYQEIQDTQVSVKEPKQAKGQPKKKAHNPRR
jgi:hypothetical protein